MSDTVRVYVNGHGVDVDAGSTVLDAVRIADAQAAGRVAAGERALTDSRGLPLDSSTAVAAGTIVRVVSARRGSTGAE